MTRRRKPRRGVLLLIVLSLLVLFVLIGTTFIVVADKYAATSFAFAKQEIKFDPPEQLLDAAVMDLLRSSRDPQSPFFHDGLLADVYGNDGFEGRVILNPTNTTS